MVRQKRTLIQHDMQLEHDAVVVLTETMCQDEDDIPDQYDEEANWEEDWWTHFCCLLNF